MRQLGNSLCVLGIVGLVAWVVYGLSSLGGTVPGWWAFLLPISALLVLWGYLLRGRASTRRIHPN